jgi:cyclase
MALEPLLPGIHVWMDDDFRFGHPNAAAVVDEDGVTVIDTLMVPSQYEPFALAVEALGLPIRRAVLTSSHIEFAGGTHRFRLAAVYGSPQASAHLDQAPNPAMLRRLYPELAAEFDDEMETRPVSHVVDAPVQLTPALAVLPATGEMAENLVVAAPGADVVFAGAMCSFGVTPLCVQGDPAAWAAGLDAIVELAPIIVPGHGPIGGEEEVRDLQAYLRACADGHIGEGPWDDWTDRAHDAVNLERAAMLAAGDDGIPPSFLRQ